jgi:hypothetical protein
MAEKKSLVEETLLQMKSLENVISENAKGILHSTMREEIGELVKESLKETEDEEFENMDTEMSEQDDDMEDDMDDDSEDETDTDDMTDTEDDMEDEDELDMDDMDDEEESDMDMTMDDEDEEPIDLTNASDEEILKVFKGMGEEDGIIVKKDGNTVDLQDTNDDAHYKISLGEGFDDEMGMEDDEFGMSDMGEMSMDDEDEDWTDISSDSEDELSFDDMGSEEEEGVVYEIVMDEEDDMDIEVSEEDMDMGMDETWSEEDESLEEGFKPKGKGIGKAKFQYKKTNGGFKETMKQGTKGVGMGKPKFEFKKGENMGGTNKIVKKTETKEASRTLGTGKRFGKLGWPKPKAAPRHLNVESVEREVKLLREKNEEYRKALNVFRSKLNEVAVFNSNLAYATRLFTEHSTTKQEKINILRRFDSVESLKESKSLYKIVKDELSSQGGNKLMKESIQEKIDRTPSSGSAANLIESKTYENPQFMRMKDLMSKMNIIK